MRTANPFPPLFLQCECVCVCLNMPNLGVVSIQHILYLLEYEFIVLCWVVSCSQVQSKLPMPCGMEFLASPLCPLQDPREWYITECGFLLSVALYECDANMSVWVLKFPHGASTWFDHRANKWAAAQQTATRGAKSQHSTSPHNLCSMKS